MNKFNFKYKYHFERESGNLIGASDSRTHWSLKGKWNNPIYCWNFEKGLAGIIFGDGINWDNKTIDRLKIEYNDFSDLMCKKDFRNENEILNDFLKALSDSSTNFLNISFKIN